VRVSAALFALVTGLSAAGCSRPRGGAVVERPPLVLLVTLDTTRADRLSGYGHARETSPQLDRLAADAVVYENAIATSSWTLPSHASLFTGKLGSVHGAGYDAEGPLSLATALPGREWEAYRARPLGEGERTLAEILKEAGYATGAVVAGPWMKRAFGLAQGFDFYDDDQIDTTDGRRADRVTDSALRFLERTAGAAFLFLNYYDPHGPYDAPEPFARRFLEKGATLGEGVPKGEELLARYDAEIAYMDHHLGRLLDELRRRGRYDPALVVVTSDHGELLGEHGRIGHGESLTEPELKIPLIVKRPRGQEPPARSRAAAQLTDVLPTILAALRLEAPRAIQGGVLPNAGHPVVAEVDPLPALAPSGRWRALYDGSLKFLWNSRGDHRLFDLAADPAEGANLFSREPERARRLAQGLEGYLASLPRPPASAGAARKLDEETQRALRSLGYVR
jgi:arylsulfatase A-like enzyme